MTWLSLLRALKRPDSISLFGIDYYGLNHFTGGRELGY
jgi:hypothetical protein